MRTPLTNNIKRYISAISYEDKKLYFIYTAIVVTKLIIVNNQGLFSYYGPHDDLLFLRQAESLLNFKWLGEYNNLTLTKGIGYPIWIAISRILHIDLLLSQHLLYIIACFIFANSISPILPNKKIKIALLLLLIFNPATYADYVGNRVIRDGIYPAITLIVFSIAFKVFFKYKNEGKSHKKYTALLSFFVSYYWLTREEGVWILPAALFFAVSSSYLIEPKAIPNYITDIIIIPTLTVITAVTLVSLLNYKVYGTYEINELKNGSFLSAYNSLMRAEINRINRLEISEKTREKIYDISPSFNSLRQTMENKHKWWYMGKSDIHNGMFIWGLRDAVAEQGHYKNASSVNIFYNQLSTEIDTACVNNQIRCLTKAYSLAPQLKKNDIKLILNRTTNSIVYSASFSGFESKSSIYNLSGIAQQFFKNLTGETISLRSDKYSIRNHIMDGIAKAYGAAIPILAILSLAITLFYIIKLRHFSIEIIIGLSLFLIYISRTILIAILDVTSFNTINMLYLASCYPFLIAASFFGFIVMYNNSRN